MPKQGIRSVIGGTVWVLMMNTSSVFLNRSEYRLNP
jgi:hypothetical protein